MDDPHLIRNTDDLREVIGQPSAAVRRKLADRLDEQARRFIAASPLVIVATCDASMRLDVSPKGDAPGFVHAEDDTTLLIPERSGNRLAFGFENLLQTGRIGLIFVIPGVRETLRVNGHAALTREPALLQRFVANERAALLCTRVTVEECFFHCGKALIRSQLWQGLSTPPSTAADAATKNWSASFGMAEDAVREKLEEDYRCRL